MSTREIWSAVWCRLKRRMNFIAVNFITAPFLGLYIPESEFKCSCLGNPPHHERWV